MRRLVVAHEEERLLRVALLEPVEGEIGDQVGAVAGVLLAAGGRDEGGIVIDALAGQDVPVVEAGGIGDQVPLADHGGLIAGALQFLGDVVALGIERFVQRVDAVLVAVLAGEDRGAAGRADGVGAEAIGEAHAAVGDAVDVRRLVDAAAVGGDGVGGVIVRHDVEDVGWRPSLGKGGGAEQANPFTTGISRHARGTVSWLADAWGRDGEMTRTSRRTLLAGTLGGSLLAQVETPQELRLPRKIRLALAGFDGHPEEILRVLPRLPDVELVAVAAEASDPAALASGLKNRYAAKARHYQTLTELLAAEQPDVVALCNHNGRRAAGILACAARKINVIAEKPLALGRADLDAVYAAVKRSGIHLGMLLPMRFDPPYLAMRRVVESGAIGDVLQMDAQKSYQLGARPEWQKHADSYGSTILWIAIHSIDLMLYVSGRSFTEAISLQSHVGFPEAGEMQNVTASLFRMDNGGCATLRMDYLRPREGAGPRGRPASRERVARHCGISGEYGCDAGDRENGSRSAARAAGAAIRVSGLPAERVSGCGAGAILAGDCAGKRGHAGRAYSGGIATVCGDWPGLRDARRGAPCGVRMLQ